jgi:hypothetical protein
VGLFSRKRVQAKSGAKPWSSVGHAAFDPADIEDARRGHPATSLEQFTAEEGLDFRGSEQAGAFVSTLPIWPDYIFNGCRGVSASGRLVTLAHELYEVRAHNGTVRAAGNFHGVKLGDYNPRLEVGGIDQATPRNEPFWGNAVWLPTTSVHVRTPEINRLPLLRFTRSTSHGVKGDNGLDRFGLPGFRTLGPDIPDETLEPIARACAPWLDDRPDAHVELRVRYGLVALTINGYDADHGDLRRLIATADGVAGVLAALTPPPSGAAFAAPGPAAGSVPLGPGRPEVHRDLARQYAEQARSWRMHDEDPSHLMELAPRCPIPGTPSGVLAGRLPGRNASARLVWFEQGGRTTGSVRGGVIVEATPGASTPIGGVVDPQTDTYLELVDGLAFCWRKSRSFGSIEADDLLASALRRLRDSAGAEV